MSRPILPDDIYRLLGSYEERLRRIEQGLHQPRTNPLEFAAPGAAADTSIDRPSAGAIRVNGVLLGGVSYVTALPASPVDGQEVYYAASPGSGVLWHLRYRSGASGSYKWEFLGGPPLHLDTETLFSTTSTSYTATGIAITAPLAGDYDIELFGLGDASAEGQQAWLTVKLGAAAASDAEAIAWRDDDFQSNMRRMRRVGLAANASLACHLRSTLGTARVHKHGLSVYPVRVAA